MSKSEDKGRCDRPKTPKTRKVLLSAVDAAMLHLMLNEYRADLEATLNRTKSSNKAKAYATENIKIIDDLKQKIFGL
jgi:hypothetical protein